MSKTPVGGTKMVEWKSDVSWDVWDGGLDCRLDQALIISQMSATSLSESLFFFTASQILLGRMRSRSTYLMGLEPEREFGHRCWTGTMAPTLFATRCTKVAKT